jgi:hypothetical protein
MLLMICVVQLAGLEYLLGVGFKCSAYTLIRQSFNNVFSPASEEDLVNLIYAVNCDILRLIYAFVGNMIEIRDQWLDDYS